MTYTQTAPEDMSEHLPRMPSWAFLKQSERIEDKAFLSGAVLTHLNLVLALPYVPAALLRARLALRAAETCVTMAGRPERIGNLRDALAFVEPGSQPGPAGEIYLRWKQAVERALSAKTLGRAIPDAVPGQISACLNTRKGMPVRKAANVLQAALQNDCRDHSRALLLADATLSRAMGWDHVMPLLGVGFQRRYLQLSGDDLHHACHGALHTVLAEWLRMASDLTVRAARLESVAPKLRAKGADAAANMLLTQDAVSATALTSLRSARAARRFCDRLIALGVVRELTGRDTFRLYGL